MHENLKRLFYQYQEGNEEAFVSLYNETSEAIWKFIRRRVPSERQEDCYQQFWLHLHSKKELYKGQPVLAWLYVILRNLIIDDYRGHKVIEISEREDDLFQIRQLLEEVLSELSPQDQLLIEKIYFQGFSYGDLEKEWGLSQTSLRKRLSRGVATLAKMFKGPV